MPLEEMSLSSDSSPALTVVAADASLAAGHEHRLQQVLAITQEMFALPPVVQALSDPDDLEHPFVLLTVSCRGSLPELVGRHVAWGDRVRHLNEDLYFRLSILPVD